MLVNIISKLEQGGAGLLAPAGKAPTDTSRCPGTSDRFSIFIRPRLAELSGGGEDLSRSSASKAMMKRRLRALSIGTVSSLGLQASRGPRRRGPCDWRQMGREVASKA